MRILERILHGIVSVFGFKKKYANGIHLLSQWKYVCSLKLCCDEEEVEKQCPGNAKAKGHSFLYQFYPKCSTIGMYC